MWCSVLQCFSAGLLLQSGNDAPHAHAEIIPLTSVGCRCPEKQIVCSCRWCLFCGQGWCCWTRQRRCSRAQRLTTLATCATRPPWRSAPLGARAAPDQAVVPSEEPRQHKHSVSPSLPPVAQLVGACAWALGSSAAEYWRRGCGAGALLLWSTSLLMPCVLCTCVPDQASSYLNKLPAALTPEDRILVVDPMLATGTPSQQAPLVFMADMRPCKRPSRSVP